VLGLLLYIRGISRRCLSAVDLGHPWKQDDSAITKHTVQEELPDKSQHTKNSTDNSSINEYLPGLIILDAWGFEFSDFDQPLRPTDSYVDASPETACTQRPPHHSCWLQHVLGRRSTGHACFYYACALNYRMRRKYTRARTLTHTTAEPNHFPFPCP
jgi:hypothetical protein